MGLTGLTGLGGGLTAAAQAAAAKLRNDTGVDWFGDNAPQVSAASPAQAPADPSPSSGHPPYAPMEGVDVNKLNDPTHNSPKYVASRILASGGSLADAAAAIGATVLDGTRMRLPTGEVVDTRRDEEGANALQWLVQHPDDGSNGGSRSVGGAPTTPTGGTAPAVPQNWGSPVLQQIADAFQARGITPTPELVNQWGSNIDAQYLQTILGTIAALPPGPGTSPSSNTGTSVPAAGGAGSVPGYAIFNAPTLKDLLASPGYEARLAEGLKGVQTSAAARGTLLTGGTLKALNQYGQNFASNEYNNLFNQRLAGNAQTSGNLLTLASLGKPS